MVIFRMLSTAVLILAMPAMIAQSKPVVDMTQQPKLKVEITSDKLIYKVSEPILVTMTLRNEGEVVVWMSKPIGVGISPGEFRVDVVAPDGTLLPNTSPVGGSVSKMPRRSQIDGLRTFLCKRVPLFPGEYWGFRRNIEDTYVSPRLPGRYKVIAKYNEQGNEYLSKSQLQNVQREIRFPIQTESITSEPLFIEIH